MLWLAGLLEGEGSFFASHRIAHGKPRVVPTVTVNMTDLDVIERVASILKAGVFTLPKKPGRKEAYRVSIRGRYAVRWMKILYPHMGNRRKQQMRDTVRAYNGRTNNSRTRVVACRKAAKGRTRDGLGRFAQGNL